MLKEELRTVCAPTDKTIGGDHKHLCDSCGTCWKHHGPHLHENATPREFDLAHSCPNCGAEQREKHYVKGDERTIDDPFGRVLAEMLAMSMGITVDELADSLCDCCN